MNIGIVTTWFERGAAYVSRQYMDLLQNNHNVFIYARGGEKYDKNNRWDLPNVTWGRKAILQTNGSPIHKADFINWITQNKLDVILFNEQQWWPPVIWAKEFNITTGAYIDYYTKETIPLFEIYDFLICNTKRHYSAFNWHKNCFYVPWGTNIDLFIPGQKKENSDKVVFFSSSGYNPDRKGVYPLIKAFYKLRGSNRKLILHSQVDLKRYYKDLAEIVDELQQQDMLEIINKIVAAPGLYHIADVYCYISKLDGIGLTLPEAISCGLQAIVPDNPPMNEFVQDGINGKVVKIERTYTRKDGYYWPCCEVDINDLVGKMQYYLDNQHLLDGLKEASRKFAEAQLNWSDREQLLAEIFNSGIKTRTSKCIKKSIYLYELFRNIRRDYFLFPYYLCRNINR